METLKAGKQLDACGIPSYQHPIPNDMLYQDSSPWLLSVTLCHRGVLSHGLIRFPKVEGAGTLLMAREKYFVEVQYQLLGKPQYVVLNCFNTR